MDKVARNNADIYIEVLLNVKRGTRMDPILYQSIIENACKEESFENIEAVFKRAETMMYHKKTKMK